MFQKIHTHIVQIAFLLILTAIMISGCSGGGGGGGNNVTPPAPLSGLLTWGTPSAYENPSDGFFPETAIREYRVYLSTDPSFSPLIPGLGDIDHYALTRDVLTSPTPTAVKLSDLQIFYNNKIERGVQYFITVRDVVGDVESNNGTDEFGNILSFKIP